MADGKSLGKGTITIKVLPGAVRVITTGKIAGLGNYREGAGKKDPGTVSEELGKKHPADSIVLL